MAFPLIETAAFACAVRTINPEPPGLDIAQALIDRAATRLAERLTRTTSLQIAIAETLAGDLRFSGDSATFDDLDTADIISVFARRTGLPVALVIIFIDVARRCGLAVRRSGFPRPFS